MFFLRNNKNSQIIIKIHELDKKELKKIAFENDMTLSTFVLNAIKFYILKGDLKNG